MKHELPDYLAACTTAPAFTAATADISRYMLSDLLRLAGERGEALQLDDQVEIKAVKQFLADKAALIHDVVDMHFSGDGSGYKVSVLSVDGKPALKHTRAMEDGDYSFSVSVLDKQIAEELVGVVLQARFTQRVMALRSQPEPQSHSAEVLFEGLGHVTSLGHGAFVLPNPRVRGSLSKMVDQFNAYAVSENGVAARLDRIGTWTHPMHPFGNMSLRKIVAEGLDTVKYPQRHLLMVEAGGQELEVDARNIVFVVKGADPTPVLQELQDYVPNAYFKANSGPMKLSAEQGMGAAKVAVGLKEQGCVFAEITQLHFETLEGAQAFVQDHQQLRFEQLDVNDPALSKYGVIGQDGVITRELKTPAFEQEMALSFGR